MNRCPRCGSDNITNYNFTTPNIYCYECDAISKDEIDKDGLLYSIYYFFKHLYYRYLLRQ